MSHPNATAAAVSGSMATLTVYLLNKYAGTHLDVAHGSAIATAYATVILFIGRRGLKGAANAVWNGVWNGAPKTPLVPTVNVHLPDPSTGVEPEVQP